MPQQTVAQMNKLCVVCGEEFGPSLTTHCTDRSLVGIAREGTLTKKVLYFTFDGKQLSTDDLERLKEIEEKRVASWRKNRDKSSETFQPSLEIDQSNSGENQNDIDDQSDFLADDLCEKCGENPGEPFEIHYGHIVTKTQNTWTQLRETSLTQVKGSDTALVCSRCIANRCRNEAIMYLMVNVVIIALVGALYFNGVEIPTEGFIVVALAIILFLITGIRPYLLKQEDVGADIAKEIVSPDLKRQGFNAFWTASQYDQLRNQK